MSRNVIPLTSLIVQRARGARINASEIGKNKKTTNNNRILEAVIAHLQDAGHPKPYSKFSSPKMGCNIAKSNFAVGQDRLD